MKEIIKYKLVKDLSPVSEMYCTLAAGITKLQQSQFSSVSDHILLNMVVLLLSHRLAFGTSNTSFDSTSMVTQLFHFVVDFLWEN